MIFDRFFTPKHQHKDPAKRLLAIREITEVSPSNKGWLHDLAFNDEDTEVKQAALTALDDFTLWLKAYEESNAEGLRKKAMQEVVTRLEDSSQVSDGIFEEIVLNKRYSDIAKKIRTPSMRLARNHALVLKSLLQDGNDIELQRFFSSTEDNAAKISVIEHFKEDEKTLKKFRKKPATSDIHDLIDAKLLDLKLKAEKPAQITKSGKLINARLNALLDSDDYDVISRTKTSLYAEFEALKTEFMYLDDASAGELTQKYLLLKASVEKRLSDMLPAHEEKLARARLGEELQTLITQVQSINDQVEHLCDVQDKLSFDTQHELLGNAINDADEQYQRLAKQLSTQPNKDIQQRQAQLPKDIKRVQQMLDNAAIIVKNNEALSSVLEKLQAILNDYEQGDLGFDELQKQFASETAGILAKEQYSTSMMSRFNEVSNPIQAHIKTASQAQKHASQRCLNKFRTVAKLISSGKYKAALHVFKAAETMFNEIPAPNRTLSKKYEEVSKDIHNIADWQSYIAAPKKPQMLEEATALSNNDTLSIKQRSDAIKQLRADWNSFGKLNTEEDDKLNDAFDLALEQAFEPCRQHYANMERQREDNANKVTAILSDLARLEDVEEHDTFINTYNALVKSFHAIKSLEHKKRKAFQQSFNQITTPLKQRIADIYQTRVNQKNRLIKQAKAIEAQTVEAQTDDANAIDATANADNTGDSDVGAQTTALTTAVDSAKQLQREWKQIGFAGKDNDKELWREFREINDRIFAALSKLKKQQKAHSDNVLDERHERLENLMQAEQLEAASSAAIASKKDQLNALRLDKSDVGNVKAKAFNGKLNHAGKTLDTLFQSKLQSEKSAQMSSLIATLIDNATEATGTVSGLIKSALEQKLQKHDVYDAFSKADLFQSVFLLLDDSAAPDDNSDPSDNDTIDASSDGSVRLALMAAKLEGKESLSPSLSFAYWLGRGSLSEDDVSLLKKHKEKLIEHAEHILQA